MEDMGKAVEPNLGDCEETSMSEERVRRKSQTLSFFNHAFCFA